MVFVTGCGGPELSKHELGTVMFEVPKVAGADKPYIMPELGDLQKHDEENPVRGR
jgi:hypothetical protein